MSVFYLTVRRCSSFRDIKVRVLLLTPCLACTMYFNIFLPCFLRDEDGLLKFSSMMNEAVVFAEGCARCSESRAVVGLAPRVWEAAEEFGKPLCPRKEIAGASGRSLGR